MDIWRLEQDLVDFEKINKKIDGEKSFLKKQNNELIEKLSNDLVIKREFTEIDQRPSSPTYLQIINNSNEIGLIDRFHRVHPYYSLAEIKLINVTFKHGEFFNKDFMSLLTNLIK